MPQAKRIQAEVGWGASSCRGLVLLLKVRKFSRALALCSDRCRMEADRDQKKESSPGL